LGGSPVSLQACCSEAEIPLAGLQGSSIPSRFYETSVKGEIYEKILFLMVKQRSWASNNGVAPLFFKVVDDTLYHDLKIVRRLKAYEVVYLLYIRTSALHIFEPGAIGLLVRDMLYV
jgi:hypothetical protein